MLLNMYNKKVYIKIKMATPARIAAELGLHKAKEGDYYRKRLEIEREEDNSRRISEGGPRPLSALEVSGLIMTIAIVLVFFVVIIGVIKRYMNVS